MSPIASATARRLDADLRDARSVRPGPTVLDVGAEVEVLSRFDQRWARGFTVAEADEDGYRVRRSSDGTVLPAWFDRDRIRPSGR